MGWAFLSTTESQCYCHQGLCQAGQHRCSQPTCSSCALRDNLEPHMHLTQHGMFSESLLDQPEKTTSPSIHPWVSGTDTGDEVIKRGDKGQRTRGEDKGRGQGACVNVGMWHSWTCSGLLKWNSTKEGEPKETGPQGCNKQTWHLREAHMSWTACTGNKGHVGKLSRAV